MKYLGSCRVCGSDALTPVIDMGEQYLATDFRKPGEPLPLQRQIPLALVRCDPTQDEDACGLLQLSVSVPPALLYERYWYRSGVNRTMTKHLRDVAAAAVAYSGAGNGAFLDIGANDGTLLSTVPSDWRRVGIDPSDVQPAIPGVETVRDLFPSPLLRGETFHVVTSIAMFYDLDDPVAFAREVHEALRPGGVWVFEQSYMPRMLTQLAYDTICHEHLEYYSLAVIERVLRDAGLRLFRAFESSINGGSLCCFAQRVEDPPRDRSDGHTNLATLRRAEFEAAFDTPAPYFDFTRRAFVHRAELLTLITTMKAHGERIHLLGASTKGNVLLQFACLDHTLIEAASERNPAKHGAFTPGTGIPIISEEESRAARPDAYLVLPWHFRDEIVERERVTIENGTRLIFPLPEISVVGRVGEAVA